MPICVSGGGTRRRQGSLGQNGIRALGRPIPSAALATLSDLFFHVPDLVLLKAT